MAREDGTWWDTVAHTCSPYTWEAEAGSCKFWVSWVRGKIMSQNLLLTDRRSSVLGGVALQGAPGILGMYVWEVRNALSTVISPGLCHCVTSFQAKHCRHMGQLVSDSG